MLEKRIVECGVCHGEIEVVEPDHAYEGRPLDRIPRTVTRYYICPHCGAEGHLTWKLINEEEMKDEAQRNCG